MNWENSRASPPLKRDFLKSFFLREKRFFLTGGSALGLFYLQHRFSYGLDLFSSAHVDWLELDGVMRVCATEIGADVGLLRDPPSFRRYRLARVGQTELVDIVMDVSPQMDPAMVSMLLDAVRVTELPDYMIKPLTAGDLRAFVDDLKRRMALMAYPDAASGRQ